LSCYYPFGSWFDIQLVLTCSQLLTMTSLFAEPSGRYPKMRERCADNISMGKA
jgi:hypothetical protein